MTDQRANDLELGFEFLADSVVVAVSGEVDILTAGVFAGALNATIDAGHRDLVVDVGGVSFFGAAGLGVFASVLLRLHPLGGTITVRSASALMQRIFDITGMSELVVFVGPESSTPHGRCLHDAAPPVAGSGGEADLAARGSSARIRSGTGVAHCGQCRVVVPVATGSATPSASRGWSVASLSSPA